MSSSADAAGVRTKSTLLLTLLSLGYFLAYFDRLLMTVVGEMVKHEFALSDKQLSLLNGAAFVIIYGACGIPMGWLGDRVSRKKIIVWSLTAWTFLTMLCGAAQSFVQLAIARAGVGIGESGLVPVANSLIGDIYPLAKRPMATAIFYSGGLVGILACFLLGTWVAGEYGWRAAFLVAGPPGLILAAAVAWLAKDPPRENAASASMSQGAAVGSAAAAGGPSTLRLVIGNRALRWVLLGGAIGTFVNIGLIQWLPNFFIRSHGLSLQQIGLFFGPVLAAGMLAGMLFGGWVGNRIAARSLTDLIWLSAWSMIVLIPIYLLIFWLDSLVAALVATFLGTALSVVYSPAYSGAWQTLCDSRARGTAAGIASFINAMIGGAICSYLVGVLSDYWAPTYGTESLRYALMASMSIPLLAFGSFLVAARIVTRQQQERPDATPDPAV